MSRFFYFHRWYLVSFSSSFMMIIIICPSTASTQSVFSFIVVCLLIIIIIIIGVFLRSLPETNFFSLFCIASFFSLHSVVYDQSHPWSTSVNNFDIYVGIHLDCSISFLPLTIIIPIYSISFSPVNLVKSSIAIIFHLFASIRSFSSSLKKKFILAQLLFVISKNVCNSTTTSNIVILSHVISSM